MNAKYRPWIYRVLMVIAILLTIGIGTYVVINGRTYFRRRYIRSLVTQIRQYDEWAPIALVSLIFIDTLIPPLPLPTPLVEVAAGILFGFGQGALLVWIAQILASTTAYWLARSFNNAVGKWIRTNRFFSFYNQFIEKHDGWAVFAFRATLTAPFNISFLAGLSEVNFFAFFLATALGVISEAAIFAYIGTLIDQRVQFPLWYLLVALVALSVLPIVGYLATKLWISSTSSRKNRSKV